MRSLWCSLILFFVLSRAHSAEPLSDALAMLKNSSDLVVVATIETESKGSMGSAPLPTAFPQLYPRELLAQRIKIEKVIAGEKPETLSPLVQFVVPAIAQTTELKSQPVLPKQPLFNTDKASQMSGIGLPILKGSKWVLFLRDHRKTSTTGKFNDEEVRYSTFDPFLSLIPYSEALELELQKQ